MPTEAQEQGDDPGRGPGMSVRGAAFIGIGSMVGAGIFALLGQAAAPALLTVALDVVWKHMRDARPEPPVSTTAQ